MPSRVLIVEDDERSRRLLVDVLGYQGHDVAAFAFGEDAIASARMQRPDIALVDLQLPGMSGFDVLAGLRILAGTVRFPILAVTASVMHSDRARILEAGFDAYVPKPVNIRDLATLLRTLLESPKP